MGRLPRVIDDALVYHAINRGNNGAAVFADEGDYLAFGEALARANGRYPFLLFGYCLMPNHFHLLLRPGPGESISRVLQSVTVAHTSRHHKKYASGGHVWQGRFKGPVIQEGGHLLAVLRYIESNPVRAGMVSKPGEYRWSSYRSHGLGLPDPLLGSFPEWERLGRTEPLRRSRWRRRFSGEPNVAELDSIRSSVHSGRPYGDPDWVEATARRLGVELTPRPRGRPPKGGVKPPPPPP